jgi:hypothetical protein
VTENFGHHAVGPATEMGRASPLLIFAPHHIAAVREAVKAHLKATGDPETIADLDASPAPKHLKFEIIAHTSKPGRVDAKKFGCPYCRHPNQFYDGRVLLCEDGKLRLIGFRCAAGQVGNASWTRAEARFTAMARREEFEQIRHVVFPAIARLYIETQQRMRDKNGALEVPGLRGAIERQLPELFEPLLMACSEAKPLRISRSVQDAKRIERQKGDAEEIFYREQITDVHRVLGASVLLQSTTPPLASFAQAVVFLEKAIRIREKTEWETIDDDGYTTALKKLTGLIRRAVTGLDQGRSVMLETKAFFSGANLRGICNWANDHECPVYRSGEASMSTHTLSFEAFDRDKTSVILPAHFSVPEFPSLDRLRTALEQLGV